VCGLQCGLGSAEDALRPTPVVGLAQLGCCQLAAGLAHSLATTTSGDLYAWGWNYEGQLGTGDAASAMLPQLVETAALDGTVRSISAGARHSVALTNGGTLYAWGCNRFAQLGVGLGSNCKLPSRVEVIADHCIVQQVSCGWWHTSVIALYDPRG
jgi:alpha-tubulin suppressor-like RCC1 family protein